MSLQPDIRYRIYPSLLEKFQRYRNAEREWESYWNVDEEGNYKKSPDEISDELKQSLLDTINRVPFDSEAADKGTVFNEIVDSFIHKKRSDRVTMCGNALTDGIEAKYNNRTFLFSFNLCQDAARYFGGALSQVEVRATIGTMYGLVELYGYVDEIVRDVVYDIKTTSRYEFGKYADGWQRHVYPYCLIESGMMDQVKSFEYTAFALKGGTSRTPLITASVCPEVYTYNHAQSTELLRKQCERFIEFLEANRELITDKKVFANE
jgi:hypothetical protein